jgi:hypothetical protein
MKKKDCPQLKEGLSSIEARQEKKSRVWSDFPLRIDFGNCATSKTWNPSTALSNAPGKPM